MSSKHQTVSEKPLNNYPYLFGILSIAVISVIAQIVIILDLFHPLIRLEVEAVSNVMSTCSEVVAGLYGITLTGYIFFADRFQNMSKEDESLYDIVQALLIRYNRMAGIISVMTLVCVVFCEGIVFYGDNTVLPQLLWRFLVDETLLFFFWTFNVILYFVISVLDPQKISRISAQKRDKLSDSRETGDLQQFLNDYNAIEAQLMALMENLLATSLPIPGRGRRPIAVYNLETLRNYSRISHVLWRKLERLRQYHNMTLHDPNLTVSKEICDLAREVRRELEQRSSE